MNLGDHKRLSFSLVEFFCESLIKFREKWIKSLVVRCKPEKVRLVVEFCGETLVRYISFFFTLHGIIHFIKMYKFSLSGISVRIRIFFHWTNISRHPAYSPSTENLYSQFEAIFLVYSYILIRKWCPRWPKVHDIYL